MLNYRRYARHNGDSILEVVWFSPAGHGTKENNMNKSYRAYLRIKRDKEGKERKKREKYTEFDNYDKLITYQHFIEALKQCRKNVSWKCSVQSYSQVPLGEIYKSINKLEKLIYPEMRNCIIKEIYERGKARTIHSVHIRDRVPQRVLCDFALTPRFNDILIYDNGASIKNKGIDFTRKRVTKHLTNAIKEYGTDFYVLKYDFKSFFDSIPHKVCRQILDDCFEDKRIVWLAMKIIHSYAKADVMQENIPEEERKKKIEAIENDEWCGICLGSQVSQIMALIVPNKLDHFIKDECGIKHYVRYMDDGLIIANTKEELKSLFRRMQDVVSELGLSFNTKKTQIIKVSRGFTFLKIKYNITDSGKIIKRLTHSGIARMRRKLKKFVHFVNEGKMTLDDVYNSMQSWLGHSGLASSYQTTKSMLALYNRLFDGYRITRHYYKTKGGRKYVLQTDKWADLRWDSNE